MTLAELRILDVWRALGGGAIRGRRGQAFWRDGDGYSISLDPERGSWYDFRDNRGGGVLALVETVLGCDRGAALAWLETHCLNPSNRPSVEDRRRYARAKAAAPALAQRLADFARGLEVISGRRLTAAHAAGIDPEHIASWHREARRLTYATAREIAEMWRVMPEQRDAVEAIGRRDREHAEQVAWLLVDLIAAAGRRAA